MQFEVGDEIVFLETGYLRTRAPIYVFFTESHGSLLSGRHKIEKGTRCKITSSNQWSSLVDISHLGIYQNDSLIRNVEVLHNIARVPALTQLAEVADV